MELRGIVRALETDRKSFCWRRSPGAKLSLMRRSALSLYGPSYPPIPYNCPSKSQRTFEAFSQKAGRFSRRILARMFRRHTSIQEMSGRSSPVQPRNQAHFSVSQGVRELKVSNWVCYSQVPRAQHARLIARAQRSSVFGTPTPF